MRPRVGVRRKGTRTKRDVLYRFYEADNDILLGGTGDDILEGRLGGDRLNGGPGNDTLIGGASIERFIFNSNRPYEAEDIGRDIITDFRQDKNDLILLDKRTFTNIGSVAGEGFSIVEEFEIVSSDAEAEGATGAIIYNQNNGNLFYNSDVISDVFGEGGLFATLDNLPALENSDFMIR
ncbi:MAG: calcium-binding protein [Cyclobacteriaceae bacterium]